jgi:hypothetical protein
MVITVNTVASSKDSRHIIQEGVQNILVGDTQTDTHTDRHTGDLISILSFLDSRLKTNPLVHWAELIPVLGLVEIKFHNFT